MKKHLFLLILDCTRGYQLVAYGYGYPYPGTRVPGYQLVRLYP